MTGSSGFIGSALCEELLRLGNRVHGIDLAAPTVEGVDATTANLIDLEEDAFPRVDVIYHLAGRAGVQPSWGDFQSYLSDNVAVTSKLLDVYSSKPKPPLFVYASSSSVYGQSDPRSGLVTQPMSPYAASKVAGDAICAVYADRLAVRSVRFFTVYGPGQRPDMAFPKLIRAGLTGETFYLNGGGSQRRHFTYIDDIVSGLVKLSEQISKDYAIYDFAFPTSRSVNEAIKIISDELGVGLNIVDAGNAQGDPSVTTPRSPHNLGSLGVEALTSLEKGLKRQIEYSGNQKEALGLREGGANRLYHVSASFNDVVRGRTSRPNTR